MKKKCPLFLTTFLLAFFALQLQAQSSNELCKEASDLIKVFDEHHYQAYPLDDTLSSHLFDLFMEQLDPDGRYFTHADIQKMATSRLKIDDDIRSQSCTFLAQATDLYKNALQRADSLIRIAAKGVVDYNKADSLVISLSGKPNYATHEKDLVQEWEKWLKYQTLLHTFQLADSSEQDKFAQFLKKEEKIREKVRQKELCNIEQILNHSRGFEKYVGSLFFNALTACYDPHSWYLSQDDMGEFEAALSTEAYSFGIDLGENQDGEIQIARLVPGGPAWKSNQLHKGDIIVKMELGEAEPVDLFCTHLGELESMLNAGDVGKLQLTVKKSNGKIETVKLFKEKIAMSENVVSSFVLTGDTKIGYIHLPGFYTEWEENNAKGCANDVATELLKLKMEKIQGLILDLRYNGGGAVHEALDLAGIFINEGPLCMSKDKTGKATILKDMNRGTIYNAPLLVLVNGYSASASEILSAILQDYGRAVIVGDTTFGKASGQVIMPVEDPPTAFSPFVKITVETFYRTNRSSYQLKGVTPDIYLPEPFHQFISREKDYPFAIKVDSIEKVLPKIKKKQLPLLALKDSSTARLSKNARFQSLLELDKSLGAPSDTKKKLPLEMKAFAQRSDRMAAIFEQADKITDGEQADFTVANNRFDKGVLSIDTYKKEMNDRVIQKIQNDFYILESYHILKDLIFLKK